MLVSLGSGKADGNVSTRINTWNLIVQSMCREPVLLLLGYGFNGVNLVNHMTSNLADVSAVSYATGPESAFMMALAYGGIVAELFIIIFYILLYKKMISNRVSSRDNVIFIGFFTGFLLNNMFSGASMFADLMYVQFILLLAVIQNQGIGYNKNRMVRQNKVVLCQY